MNDPPGWLDRIAHDLRGPLMPLQTAAYLLRSGQLDSDRQAELIGVIERQTRQLTRMIDELGDWMRASQQRLLGPREPCDIALLLEYAATGAQIPLPRVEDASDGATVDGDTQRLTQLLRILLAYAATAGATPTVRMDRIDARLQVDVLAPADEEEEAPAAALFEAPQSTPFDGGLGLQLLLAKRIAEAHGGTLDASDADGQRRLRLTLPLSRETATP
jgi:signal transduction histidine kinase